MGVIKPAVTLDPEVPAFIDLIDQEEYSFFVAYRCERTGGMAVSAHPQASVCPFCGEEAFTLDGMANGHVRIGLEEAYRALRESVVVWVLELGTMRDVDLVAIFLTRDKWPLEVLSRCTVSARKE